MDATVTMRTAAGQSPNTATAGSHRWPDFRPVWRAAHDGAAYCLRPLFQSDRGNEKAFIDSLSAQSRYQRLMFTQSEASESFMDSMMQLDYTNTMALAAVAASPGGESIIGVARYAPGAAPREIEFAIVVADRWQRRGVGVQLLRCLFDYARTRKFVLACGVTFANNAGMLALARRLGMSVMADAEDDSVLDVAVHLQRL